MVVKGQDESLQSPCNDGYFITRKKTVGEAEISAGITGSSKLSADDIKKCRDELEKLGFTDIRFE